MKLEGYHLKADEALSVFEFINVGSKGAITNRNTRTKQSCFW